MADNSVGTLAAVIIIAVLAIVAFQLIGPFLDASSGGQTVDVQQDLVRLDGSGFHNVGDRHVTGSDETVFLTRGNAVRLTGADDSFVESDSTIDFATDGNWTVSTWAKVNSSAASDNMTAVSLNGRVLIQYNGSESNWSVWYFDDGTRDSWRANVSAPNQPGNFSLITATHNGTHLSIFRNTTAGDVVNTSAGDNIEPVWVNATNWNGDLEETRTFDDALNSSQRSALHSSPSQPLANATRTVRLMYDEGRGDSTFIIFADIDASLSNATWVDGHPEQQVSAGSDYEWRDDGPQVRVVSGGALADAPVLYADYDSLTDVVRVGESVGESLELIPAVLLVLVASMAIIVLRELG